MDVMIIFGSASDLEIAREAAAALKKLGISLETRVASAHRSPRKVLALVKRAETQGAKVIIAGAGMSAHLAGVIASHTLLPVLGVPVPGGPLGGVDALLSTVNMPGGVPVGTMSMGKAGGLNAALLAARIIALSNKAAAKKLAAWRDEMAKAVDRADLEARK
ncbi:MAG: 5-(carboxyamino)imidazole ribonucleotide mutase [Nitrospinae bacterium]|nr:5-(carboxyamino)imidazole ribonucleotide mutase [Nitrospinota bacterium]